METNYLLKQAVIRKLQEREELRKEAFLSLLTKAPRLASFTSKALGGISRVSGAARGVGRGALNMADRGASALGSAATKHMPTFSKAVSGLGHGKVATGLNSWGAMGGAMGIGMAGNAAMSPMVRSPAQAGRAAAGMMNPNSFIM